MQRYKNPDKGPASSQFNWSFENSNSLKKSSPNPHTHAHMQTRTILTAVLTTYHKTNLTVVHAGGLHNKAHKQPPLPHLPHPQTIHIYLNSIILLTIPLFFLPCGVWIQPSINFFFQKDITWCSPHFWVSGMGGPGTDSIFSNSHR